MLDYLKIIEKTLNKKAKIQFKSFQKGDVYKTFGDTKELFKYVNYRPKTKIEDGIKLFCEWYAKYYN